MTLRLDEVRDLDCVASFAPLTFDSSPKEVTGAAAILRRILYGICGLYIDLRDLIGATIDDTDRIGLEAAVERVASAEDFVLSATCLIRLNRNTGAVTMKLAVGLVDGKTYPLEVTVSEAGDVIVKLGGLAA